MAQVSYGTITITDTNDIESITMEYAQSTSNSTAPTSGWSENIPTWEQGKYIWQRTRIHKSGTASSADEIGDPVCLTGSTGATGTTGRGVSSIVTSYCNYGTGTPAASYSGWGSTVPVYDSSKPNYWVKVVITYTSGSPATDTSIYKDNGITDATATAANANTTAAQANQTANQANQTANTAASNASNALSIATGINQHFWTISTDYATGVPAGSYITDTAIDTFKSQKTGGNLLTRSDGIYIRNGVNTLTSLVSTALTFYNPSTNNAQLIIGANGTLQSGNYSRGSNSKFASDGTRIDLTNGDIITKYFRVSQGLEQGLTAGAYIYGTIEALDGKIGTDSTNYWEIGNGTDYNLNDTAKMIGHGSSYIQLGNSSTWRLATNRIHTGWYISSDSVLHYPTIDSKYWDFGIHVPNSDSPTGRGSDKFIYIRTQNAANNSLQNLLYDIDDNYSAAQWEYKFYIDKAGNITTTGSIDAHSISIDGQSIAGGSLIAGSLASYGGSSNRPVYFPSSGDNQGKPVQITVTDNSSATAVTSTDTNLITARTLYYAGYTKNTGTVTSVRVQATSPVQSSTSTAQSTTLNTTISLADGYGDTKNPYASKTKNYVLAAPSTAAGAPSFRLLVASDIPDLSATYLPLTGGTITGSVIFGDSVTIEDLTTDSLVVEGSASIVDNLSVNSINGVTVGNSPKFTDNNTTYTFANGTNGFTVTPSGGSAQTVTVTPSITNNVTGTGTSGSLAKWNGAHTLTDGPAIGSGTTKYLREDGTWQIPSGTYSLSVATYNTLGGVKPAYSSTNAATLTTTAATNTTTPTIAAKSTTSGRYYAIETDKNGVLFVNVPWTNVNSSYLTSETDPVFSASAAAGITSSDISNWNSKTSNTGTVTSVRVQASSPLQSSTSTAQSTTLNTTISFVNQNVNTVLAGPSSGTAAAAPTFRALVAADIPALAWSKITSGKPTTLSGYGITDANISNGVITLGSNTITPLTSHQTVTNSAPTLAWGETATIGSVGGTSLTVTMPANPNTDNDTKVTQTNTTGSAEYRVLFSENANDTTQTATARKSTNFKYNPSTGTVTATTFVGALTGTASGNLTSNSSLAWGKITGAPTTLSGYGITDAKIANGVITLGSNTITPLTSQWTANLVTSASATAQANAAASTNVYLNLVENSTVRNSHQITGSGTVSVASDANGKITITGSAHPTSLKNPNALSVKVYNGTNTSSDISYDGSASGQSISVAGTNAITGIASTNDGKLQLTLADGTQPTPITVKITATTSDTAASADKLNLSADAGSTSIPVYFPASTGLPTVVTSIAYSLLPVGTGASQVAQGNHTHGNITNGGDITATAPTVANGDQIIINDHSASKITNGPTFDGSTTTAFLTKAGTWATPTGTYSLPLAASGTRGGVQIGYTTSGKNYAVQLSSEKMYVNVPWENTTYSAGTGLSLSGTTFNHSNSVTAGTAGTSSATSSTNRTIAVPYVTYDAQGHITGSGTHTHTIDTYPEAYLAWGGKNFSGSYGPIDAAMIDVLGANRFAFLKAAGLTIEYSTDAGSTWTDYGATDVQKTGLFGAGQGFTLGKHTANGSSTVNDRLRVTINTGTAGLYTVLNKIAIYMSTAGNTVQVLLEKALQSTPTTYSTHLDWTGITGWSGWNILNISGLTTYGNTAASQYGRVRFTFRQTAVNNGSYPAANISRIMGFGGVGWNVPSNMARDGHLYSYDNSQNATFPAQITATQFNGPATKLTTSTGSATVPVYFSNGVPTNASTYAGGTKVTLNDSDKGASTASFYAPTTAGTENYILASNGSGAPKWIAQSTITSGNTDSYHTGDGWTGLTYKLGKVGNASDISITIPTGTTSTTVLRGDHTYATSIATSTGTNQITLAYGTKYALTAGGTSYVFTMPASDNTNTWRAIQVDGTQILGTGTNTGALNLKAGSNVSITNSSGTVTIAATDTNTHNTAYLYAGASNGTANAVTTNGNTYLILMDGGSATTRRKISGTQNVSVASDSSGNITITGPDLSGYATTSSIPSNIVNTITTTAGAHTAITSQKGDVSFKVPTTAAHVGIKFGYTTSGNNRAVLQDSNGNLYITQKDDNSNTTYTLTNALASHKFTWTLTAGGSGSGSTTTTAELVAGTGITLTDDTTNKKITIGCSITNTDTKVTQSASTTSNWRKLLLHYKDDAASTTAVTSSTEQVYAAVGISAQPSTGIVRTNGYNMSDKAQMVYDSTLDAIVFTFL